MKSFNELIEEAVSSFSFYIKRVITLTWNIITQWFENWWNKKNAIPEQDKENIAFTIDEALKSGKYKVIQGVFNKRTKEVVDGIQYEAETLDEELEENHRNNKVVFYPTNDLPI